MMKAIEQQIFDAVFAKCLEVNSSTFAYLPAATFTDDFIFVGEQQNVDIQNNKSYIYLDTEITIHFYYGVNDRNKLVLDLKELKRKIRSIEKVGEAEVAVTNLSERVMLDTTSDVPLNHAILIIRMKID